jgi:phosphate uptake regulator
MQLRKVQEMGGATLLISLPKEWARNSSIHKGSVVQIENAGDGGLLIYPAREGAEDGRSEKEIVIEYPSRFSNEGLPNEITAAYLLGYDLIRVKGKYRISAKDREGIVRSIKSLIGLEVVEEDALSITSQFLVDNTAVEPNKIFKRISTIVRAMISDTLKQFIAGEPSQFESISQRDDEVDRLHFLLVRLIRTAVRDPRTASKFKLTAIDCLDYRVAASSLETAGDYAVELAGSVARLDRVGDRKAKEIELLADLLDTIQDGAARAFIARDFSLARSVIRNHESIERMLEEMREERKSAEPEFLHLGDIIERIARSQRDIADLISPMVPAS